MPLASLYSKSSDLSVGAKLYQEQSLKLTTEATRKSGPHLKIVTSLTTHLKISLNEKVPRSFDIPRRASNVKSGRTLHSPERNSDLYD